MALIIPPRAKQSKRTTDQHRLPLPKQAGPTSKQPSFNALLIRGISGVPVCDRADDGVGEGDPCHSHCRLGF